MVDRSLWSPQANAALTQNAHQFELLNGRSFGDAYFFALDEAEIHAREAKRGLWGRSALRAAIGNGGDCRKMSEINCGDVALSL